MTKRKRSAQSVESATPSPSNTDIAANESVIISSSLSLHELFQQQVTAMLDRADLSEEQKQQVLIAMACPCCGAGAMSYTVKLRR